LLVAHECLRGRVRPIHQFGVVIPNTDQSPPATLASLGPARCDSSSLFKQFGKIIPGCVFKDRAGSYDVYLSGKGEDAVAKNVQTAQKTKSRHFGWHGHGDSLTRAPSSVQTLNRRAACGKTNYKKPYSCRTSR
jgi:hypothetical protein